MSIIRAPQPDRGFTIIRDTVVRDSRLSYRARGVLLAILSRPSNWRTDAEQLAKEGREGREAIRAAMRELEAAGYLRRRRVRGERGQWITETVVYDEALTDAREPVAGEHSGEDKTAGRADDGFSGVGNPGVGNPDVGNPDVGGPGAVLKTEKKTKEQNLSSAFADEENARPDVEHLCNTLADLIESNGEPRPTIGKRWRTDCRLMLDRDDRDPAKAENLMRWAAADPFWSTVILSMTKFRKQYGALRLRALTEHRRRQQHPGPDGASLATTDQRVLEAQALKRGPGRPGQLAIGDVR